MKNIALKFDSKAIIKLLGVQLYDTPMAMLRENVQNGFDAVKERQEKDKEYKNPCVKITITDQQVIVTDNGIGMNKQDLIDNTNKFSLLLKKVNLKENKNKYYV